MNEHEKKKFKGKKKVMVMEQLFMAAITEENKN